MQNQASGKAPVKQIALTPNASNLNLDQRQTALPISVMSNLEVYFLFWHISIQDVIASDRIRKVCSPCSFFKFFKQCISFSLLLLVFL